VHLWTLDTIRNPIRKYVPFIEWLFLLRHWFFTFVSPRFGSTKTSDFSSTKLLDAEDGSVTLRLNNPILNWKVMSIHASQFLWYRRIFVIFGCYTYMNRLRRVETWSARDFGSERHED
jgi:N-acetylglucosaminylphosphatidylinositol deacetylase